MIQAAEVIDVLWRSRFRIVAIFCCLVALLVAGLPFVPKTYLSEAKILIRLGRESVGLDPTATVGQTLAVNESRETELNSIVDVMQSRSMVEAIVDRLGPDVVLGKAELDAKAADGGTSASGFSLGSLFAAIPRPRFGPGLSDREKAIVGLEKAITISLTKRSSVVSVSCKAKTPRLAQRIVAEMLAVFMERYIGSSRTEGSTAFFVGKQNAVRETLLNLQNEIRDAKNLAGISSVEGGRKMLQDQIVVAQTEVMRAESSLAAATAAVEVLQQQLDEQPLTVVSKTQGFPNDGIDRSRQTLYELLSKESELASRYNDTHPRLIALRKQIQRARVTIGEETPTTQTLSALNPSRQQLEVKLAEELAKASAADSQLRQAKALAASLNERLLVLNGVEGRIESLGKELEIAQANMKSYSEKLEQARVVDELVAHRICNVNVFQQPTYSEKPTGPTNSTMFAMGLVVAAGAAIGLPLLMFVLGRVRENLVRVQLPPPMLSAA
jgi:uncharacterized protein involved in exopolysaccharide biosynthesis